MKIGIPREIKDHEFRVAITPQGAARLVRAGHEVWVQKDAGARIGYLDAHYLQAGAKIAASAAEIYLADLLLKVKEPQPAEYPLLRAGQILFCYLHLAAEKKLAAELLASGVSAIGFETVTDTSGSLPLLTPMSVIAGRLAVQAGAAALTMVGGGSGILLSGVPGVLPAKVSVLGAGVVGANAARLSHAMGADVTVFDVNVRALEILEARGIKTCFSSPENIAAQIAQTDLVIGAALLPGKQAPKLVSLAMVKTMKPGSAIVDVSIDQGGSAETSRATTHSLPTYVEENVVHYCVTNMPALAAKTATEALAQATLPYVLQLADLGLEKALEKDHGFKGGLQVHQGKIVHEAVAEALDLPMSNG